MYKDVFGGGNKIAPADIEHQIKPILEVKSVAKAKSVTPGTISKRGQDIEKWRVQTGVIARQEPEYKKLKSRCNSQWQLKRARTAGHEAEEESPRLG